MHAMDDGFRDKWVNGLLFPGFVLVWGISSLMSGKIVILIRRFESLPIYYRLPLHGWPAMCISAGLIFLGLGAHFGFFWYRYPKWQRISSVAATCTVWTAVVLFAVGIVVWSVGNFLELCR